MASQRRLAAILHSDLAGFTRLMEAGETRTFRHLKSVQVEVWRPAIDQGGGRMVGTAGDAILAEFGSARDALDAAMNIQRRMAEFNQGLVEDQRLQFRIGIHLGEVIVDEEDQNIFGDGVNVAARIQALAEPGGIAVSRAVRDVTELNPAYGFVDAGEQRLKNVSRPIQVYHIRDSAALSARTTSRMVPDVTMRFEGADSTGRKFAFDLPLSRLMAQPNGMLIGRAGEQCELPIAHATVSRRHARLLMAADALQIEDLGSTNGTVVDGVALTRGTPVAVHSGTKLKIGDVALTVRRA